MRTTSSAHAQLRLFPQGRLLQAWINFPSQMGGGGESEQSVWKGLTMHVLIPRREVVIQGGWLLADYPLDLERKEGQQRGKEILYRMWIFLTRDFTGRIQVYNSVAFSVRSFRLTDGTMAHMYTSGGPSGIRKPEVTGKQKNDQPPWHLLNLRCSSIILILASIDKAIGLCNQPWSNS
ncbi:uncharacterized protein LOC118151553 isoform X2 [Callithrix jacchus]|uniref:uncharacterized protein LOC118151553 isoform X2 n=1 Tax=Callithrix jacchus TaxID=9483 RepID=UPI00159D76EA|nr:uncharacterized protein LOC118151553 isoform X2 [Callithrix jacchus]